MYRWCVLLRLSAKLLRASVLRRMFLCGVRQLSGCGGDLTVLDFCAQHGEKLAEPSG
jgi:hypothetical protein